MAIRSGKYAYVDGVPCTEAWSVNRNSTASRYIASCVPDGSAAVEGNIEESGSMNGFGYLPPMPSEDDFPFVGVASAKPGEIVNYVGDVLVMDATIQMPVKAGTPITWTSNFGVQGELTQENVTLYEDPTRSPAPSAKWGKIQIEQTIDEGDWVDIVVQNAQITFRRSVAINVQNGLTYREAGNLEAEINFAVENDDLDVDLYEVNATKNVRVYVTETLFYYFDAILFQAQTNFQVSRSANTMIGYTVNGLWTALRERDPDALGQILLPGGDEFYGEGS